MSKRDTYEKKTEELLGKIIEENNYELVDVEFVKEGTNRYLRVYIDKEGGITVDDCEIVSRALGELLDVEDFIDEAYILEVSSPGLGRQLKKDKDLNRSLGDKVEVKLYKAIDGQKEYEGILEEFNADTITITPDNSSELIIERGNIAIIKLAFDF